MRQKAKISLRLGYYGTRPRVWAYLQLGKLDFRLEEQRFRVRDYDTVLSFVEKWKRRVRRYDLEMEITPFLKDTLDTVRR